MTANEPTLAAAVYDGPTVPTRADAGAPVGLISDRYAIEGLLGSGGMSVVFAARDRVLDRPVALKVIRGARDDIADDRLVREARAMARLSHPNVIPVFDVGVAANGPVYVAMELVDGVTLDRWLRERSEDPAAIVSAFVAAGHGLAAAHAAGLVHRDFKPENVMVGTDGRVRVLDFGLARAASGESESFDGDTSPGIGVTPESALTVTGAIVGTPRYMSPEQWRGEPMDARTDQFSFCIALAAALGGEHPFDDTSPAAHRDAVLAGALRLSTTIPPPIAAVLRRGLAHHRDDRFATMDELVAALQPPAPTSRGRSRLVGLAAAVVAIVLGGVAIATWRAPGARAPAPAAATAPASGYRCGPNFETYAIVASGDSRGVRCVMFARDQDGTPWLAWYGEGVHDAARYRQIGEGRLGGAGTAADLTGNGEGAGVPFDDTLHLASVDSSTPPQRIAVGGVRDETWIHTDGTHADYTTVFTEPIRMCGPRLTRYRVYPKIERSWGFSVGCVTPSGRTWLNAGAWSRDPFMGVGTVGYQDGAPTPVGGSLCLPGIACGVMIDGVEQHGRHGEVAVRPRELPGVGAGLELSGLWPELWFPWTRRYSVRIHAVRIVDDEAPEDVPVSVAEVERSVRRANQLLAPAGIEVFFLAEDNGRDLETLYRSVVDDSTEAALQDEHPYKVLVFFRGGEAPQDDRLAHTIAARLGLPGIPDRALSPDQAARLEERLRELRLE